MPYAKATLALERYGQLQVGLSLFSSKGDPRHNDARFYQVDQASLAFLLGYQGLVDVEGRPLDIEQYAAWEKSLPRVWLAERKFHTHFIYLDPYTMRDEDITEAMAHHLPNFNRAWLDERDKEQGGMRHGWDVACRKPRPKRYNKLEPERYSQRKLDCLSKVALLRASTIALQVNGEGETFPATEIIMGMAATSRGTNLLHSSQTAVNMAATANADGAIDTIQIYIVIANATATWVGTFSEGASNVLTCRDSQNAGAFVKDATRTATGLDIDVITGDFIGTHDKGSSTWISTDSSGNSGVWSASGEYIDPTDSTTFSVLASYAISLYGTGETAGWGNIAKVGGVVSAGMAKMNSVAVADIAKVNGVAV